MAYNSTPFHGKLSRIEKGGTKVEYTIDFSVSVSLEMADKTAQGDSWKSALPGVASWNGTMNMYFVAGNTEQKAMMDNIINATPGTKLTDVKLLLDADTNAFTGDIYITGFSSTVAMGDVVKCSFPFQGDGVLSLVSNA